MTREPRQIAHYGWRKDQLDPRDRIFNLEERVLQGHQLPGEVDLQLEMPPVYDQGQLGSCTANAAAALLEHQAMRQGEPVATPSRLFIYYEERRIEGQPPDQDTGAEVRDGIKVLVSDGAPAESEWPYDVARFGEQPSQKAYIDAVAHEALVYKRIVIGPGAPMRSALASHQPIAFGFQVPAYFETYDAALEFLPVPEPGAGFIGGHAVVVVGYDYTRHRFPVPVFKVRNSWSDSWGAGGYFWMAAEWFSPFRGLADDLWIVSKVK